MMQKKLQVEAIEQGSVIDHIPAQQGVKILKFFKFTQTNEKVTIGLNLATHNGKPKDLIKIENTFFSDQQANQLALFAKVQLPSSFIGALVCPNSNCISHNEPVNSRFYVHNKNTLKLKCHYCEKSFERSTFDELD